MSPLAYALALAGGVMVERRVEIIEYAYAVMPASVMRVPAARWHPLPNRPQRWRERGGPRCVPMSALAGAQVMGPDVVDLVLRGGRRLRARLANACPTIGFYSGFYLASSSDGKICAGRDVIRSRAGGECEISKFRLLTPAK